MQAAPGPRCRLRRQRKPCARGAGRPTAPKPPVCACLMLPATGHGQVLLRRPRPKGKAHGRPRKAAGREAGPSFKPACHAPQVRRRGKLRRPCGGKPCRTRGPRTAEAKRARKPCFRPPWRPGCAHAAVAPPPSMRTRPRAASEARASQATARLRAGPSRPRRRLCALAW
jgi:hypothetical protein